MIIIIREKKITLKLDIGGTSPRYSLTGNCDCNVAWTDGTTES